MAELLTRMGVPCTHEGVYLPSGLGTWMASAESSWMAVPWLGELDADYTYTVMQLVRHPLHVVRSMVSMGLFNDGPTGAVHGRHRLFLERHAPSVFELHGPVERAAAFVLLWNELAAKHTDWQQRVEEVNGTTLAKACHAADHTWDGGLALQALESVPTDMNTRVRAGARMDWEQIAEPWSGRLREHAAACGY